MKLLTSTTHTLDVITSAALALDVDAHFIDNLNGALSPGSQQTAIVTATTTVVVAAPGAGTCRAIQEISFRNKGAGVQIVTVRRTNSTGPVSTEWYKATLNQDDVLVYEDACGWYIIDSLGARKAGTGVGRLLRSVRVIATGNWTPGAGTKSAFIRMLGSGGGGGGTTTAAASAAVGAGGGSGAYLERLIAVSEGTAYAAVIGAAGAAGAATGAAGGNGGNTTLTIGATVLTAPGGAGGAGMTPAAATVLLARGGDGGAVSTNGDIATLGDAGRDGVRVSGTVGWSGAGGDTPLGGGAPGKVAQSAGSAGTTPGSGGSGGCTLNAGVAVVGGAGALGIILIDEYS